MSCNPGIPTIIQAGDVVSFSVRLSGFDSALYSARFVLAGIETGYGYDPVTVSGEDYGFTIPSVQSASIKPGRYQASLATFTLSDKSRKIYYTNFLTVKADPEATGGLGKSKWRVVLDKCDEGLKLLASGTNSSFSVEGQMWTKRSLKEFLDFRNQIAEKVRAEEIASGISLERGGVKKIRTQFTTR